ncbi:DMT family transporter [Myxococcus sp. K38C18041901]|uniref:DMT family transporter n=1 Tax=Myxococcus guangdongensis TaxID=2906760 RepID=UPI0020A7895C|nr:DMT family transporter [Myxococcus guangdongensis]MCP3060707.1 DMT family transporter [Myxococcus guangdongensis]
MSSRWVLPVRYRGTPLLVFASVLFAVMALCTRLLAGRLSPGQVASGRFAIGLLFLALFFPLTRRRPRFGRVHLWALRGIFGGAAVYLYFVALDRLSVGPAVLLNACWPIYAAIIGWLFLGERVTGALLAGLVLTTVGAGLVMWSTVAQDVSLTLGLGAWAGMASAVLGGAAVVVIRALRHETDAATVFLSFCLFGLLFSLPFALADWRPLGWDVVLPLLGVGVSSVVAQMAFTYALGYVTAVAGGVATQSTPVFSWVLAALLLDEAVSPLAVTGALVCMVGVLWGTGVLERLRAPQSRPAP